MTLEEYVDFSNEPFFYCLCLATRSTSISARFRPSISITWDISKEAKWYTYMVGMTEKLYSDLVRVEA